MKLHETIKRYYLIINKVSGTGKPQFERIREYLYDNDFEISKRTLQRDLNNIRYEFGIEIKYDRFADGYYIDKDESPDIDYFMRFFEMTILSGTITESLKDGHVAKEYISFDSNESLLGADYINPVLFAIKTKRMVEISYRPFVLEEPYRVVVKPGLLKESQKRWYMVGIRADVNELRTYGLDRIKEIKILDKGFDSNEVKHIKKIYDNVLGITYFDKKAEKIILKVAPLIGNYIKTLPWHDSQKIITDNKDGLIVQYKLIPNFELKQKILSVGNDIEVLNPKWLRDEISKIYKDTLKKYI